MHHANHFYGHAHVLAQYCGLDPEHPPRIEGYLQHGWNVVDGLGAGTPYVSGRPIFVWSEQTRRRAWSMGRRYATVVGAPFLYLLELQPQPAEPEPREGTIWYPFHGWESQQVKGSHRRLIDEIMATETGPVTFCLYWNEYRTDRVRAEYEKAGRVICHGYRGFWWRDTDREFLVRQLAELRRHRRVVSNRLCSAIWYGLLAGCQGAVYGDPMVLENGDPTFGGEPRLHRQWPEVYGYDPDQAAGYRIARAELGADELAGPEELRTLLGWPVADRSLTLAG